MSFVYLGVYTIFVVMIWWFFAVARIHAYKFKNFSSHIPKVTTILFFILLVLTILWYLIIFSLWDYQRKIEINTNIPNLIDEESY